MSNTTLSHAAPTQALTNRRPQQPAGGAAGRPENGSAAHPEHAESAAPAQGTWRGFAGLLAFGLALVAAAGLLGARTWQVGAALGSALFPVEDIVELAAVAVGTVVAGWAGLHALIALACVLAGRRGRRWGAGERAVARHAPAVVRRLARAAAGAGIGLALTAPTAMALPGWGTGAAASADHPVVAVELGWQPTDGVTGDRKAAGGRIPDRSTSPCSSPAPERSSLVNRGLRAGMERKPLVVVEPGDTLWAIAADRLATEQAATDPSGAEVAAAVARWHRTNRQVLGANPDLIHPGTVLHQP
jgi:nucleoid-associated protein YgaU